MNIIRAGLFSVARQAGKACVDSPSRLPSALLKFDGDAGNSVVIRVPTIFSFTKSIFSKITNKPRSVRFFLSLPPIHFTIVASPTRPAWPEAVRRVNTCPYNAP